MRIAIFHDHLRFIGGGERVALFLAAALDADLFVTDLNPQLPVKARLPQARVTELAKVPTTPLIRQRRQKASFRRAHFPGYDGYVVSGNWAMFAANRHRPNVWYCHTPVRVFYDLQEDVLGGLSRWRRWTVERWIRSQRPEYEAAVAGVERIVANSRTVAERIRKHLGRSAYVVHPPVDVARYRFERVGDFWLSVNRLSHEKRIELQVEAFRRLPGERLVVVGGPQMGVDAVRFVRSLSPPANVEFLGEVEEDRLLDLYATCRGLVATSKDEDFGLSPLEAMASGKPVVAVDEGGYRETVVPNKTGWLVSADPDAIVAAVEHARPETTGPMRRACEARAWEFDVPRFVGGMKEIIERSFVRT